MSTRTYHRVTERHRPRFFRFEFFHPAFKGGLRFQRNPDDGARVGLSVNIGRHVYGVKWASTSTRIEDPEGAATELTRHDQDHGMYEEGK